MGLIRSVCRPANAGLSLRFQRCQDTKISSACLHPVLNETSNPVHTSNILCNDRSYAASASASAASSALEDRKPQKRVSKSERRNMVENYVNKYREKTEGKFPSPTDTMKDVGGSYYVVRQILQEMIYNSKQSSMACKDTSLDKSTRKKNEMIYNSKESEDIKDISLEKSAIKNHEMVSNAKEQSMYTNDTSLEKSTMKEDRRSTKFEEVPQSRELDKGTRPIVKDIEISSSMIFQSKEGQEPSVSNETDEPKDIGAQSHHPIDKLESSQNLDYGKDVKQEILEDHVKSDALERKARGQESMEISGRGSQQMPSEEAEAQQKSSVWNNLKSFANGIFSLWKRS